MAEFTAEVGQEEDSGPAGLDALAITLAGERGEYIQGREQSGIETQWLEDQEFYEGIDDANRSESATTWGTKPPGQAMPKAKSVTRSTVFPQITRPYVDAASARLSDMLLPTDDRPWAIKPTPISDLVEISKGNVPDNIASQAAMMGTDPASLQAQAAKMLEEAKTKAENAQKQIEDWQIECQYHGEVRKVIEDASRIGVGILKGPVPVKRRAIALSENGKLAQQGVMQRLLSGVRGFFNSNQQAITTLIVKEEVKPASKRIDPWNFYPDPSCGENIHNGTACWERDYLTRKQLEDLKDEKLGYIVSQIVLCLDEGPQKASAAQAKKEPDKRKDDHEDKRFEIWYRHGVLTREQLQEAGCECEDQNADSIPALLTMVNDHVIKAALDPLDSGEFPYDLMPWQSKSGMPWGNGVSRQGRTAQRIVTGGVRHMMDNAGLSAGVQIVIGSQIVPQDGEWSLTPRKIWQMAEDADIDDVRKAMHFFEIPSRQEELQAIIQFGMKLFEDATGLPMLLQGQQGEAPDTVGGMTMLNNNASAVLRRLARTYDDRITEPHTRRYYSWVLQHGKDDQKGDFQIDARGSTALVERDLQNQQIPAIIKASLDVRFGIDPKKAMSQFLKSQRFNPKDWEFDDDRWEQILTQMSQKPADPRVEVETIKAKAADQRLAKEQQFEAQQTQGDHQVETLLKSMDEHIEYMKLTGAGEQTISEIKADLAGLAMKLRKQDEMHAQDLAADLHKHANPSPVVNPPTEPPGRAKPGRAFEA